MPPMSSRNERNRLSAEDWENGVLDMIAEEGVNALGEERELQNHVVSIDEPRARLRELFHRVAREARPHRVYAAFLQALELAPVAHVMGRVSQRRLEFLNQAYRQAGMNKSEAAHRARLAYAAYVGFLQLSLITELPRLSQEQFDAYVEHVIATLVPE